MIEPERLPPGQQLAAPGKWPIVGEKTPAATDEWTLEICGLVHQPHCWSLEALRAMPRVERSIDIHCVTRWSKLGMSFRGIPIVTLLEACGPLDAAKYVSFIAASERHHSTSLPLAECRALDVLLALEADGKPLEEEHGGPLRIVTPRKYFYKSVKWVKRIELLADDRLGYWEAVAGYHNEADPWLEQRYLASTVDKREAARLIAARNFRGLDLRGLHAAGHSLDQLDATDALLRDANFRAASLRGATFEGANLSNAHFERADLRECSLRNADLEGANFEGADLRGADLRGASLFGATFVAHDGTGAAIDDSTHVDRAGLEQLTPRQAEFIARVCK